MSLLPNVVLAAAVGTLPAWIAQRKGRCFVDWWLYGAALFIIALPHALLLKTAPSRCIYKGVFLLATSRAAGMAYFTGAPERLIASLASLALWPAIGALLLLSQGEGRTALSDLLATGCALLAPLVLSYEAARYWGRAASWLRFAVAFNWCQWAILVLAVVLVVLVEGLLALGVPREAGVVLVLLVLAGYGLWLHWFLARHGLGLDGARAALLVVGVNLASILLLLGPRLLVLALGGSVAEE